MAKKRKLNTTQAAYKGDCISGLQSMPPNSVMLAIGDPPYNFGQPYEACHDNKSYDDYMEWTRKWLTAVDWCLHKYGSLWIFVPDEWVSEIDMLMRHEMGYYRRGWIVWAFTFGQAAQTNFTPSHCHLLYYTKTKTKFTFNHEPVRVPSARQIKYNDKRAQSGGKMPDNTWMLLKEQLEPYMTPDKNTWLESRICGTFKERKKHSPNQIPMPIMERIVLTCSNPGDRVVDPFCGTGPVGVVCAQHDRDYVGYDVSKTCVKETNDRIKKAREGKAVGPSKL
jgi:DNA modification methylase